MALISCRFICRGAPRSARVQETLTGTLYLGFPIWTDLRGLLPLLRQDGYRNSDERGVAHRDTRRHLGCLLTSRPVAFPMGSRTLWSQDAAAGDLEAAQALFDHGRLIAFHAYRSPWG